MNMYLIITEASYGAIDASDYACHDYYIIIFSSYTYTLQVYLNIYGRFISLGEMVCEGTYYFSISINYNDYVPPKHKSNNTVASMRKIINGTVNEKCYDSNDVVTSF